MSSNSTYNQLFVDELVLLCGKENVSTSIIEKVSYSRDAFPLVYKWIMSGKKAYMPDYIVWPTTTEQVSEIVRLCNREKIPFTPYGAGSGIVGGALATRGGLIIDLKRLNRIIKIDEKSSTVKVETGIIGQEFEEQLNRKGFTCGHYPQSIRQSTVGGWLAHRGVGTYSTKYGKIDDMVIAIKVVLPTGEILETREVPKSATGPNLNELFIGSEGTLGIITEVTMQFHRIPQKEIFVAYSIDTFAQGIDCIQKVIHENVRPAVVRLYDVIEANHHFSDLGIQPNGCVLLFGMAGSNDFVSLEKTVIERIAQEMDLNSLGSVIGEKWLERRFSTVGLCNKLRERGGIADALEVTGTWLQLNTIYEAMKQGMEEVIQGRGVVFGHVSHAYHSGANLYMIFHANDVSDQEAEHLYYEILQGAFNACLNNSGTLSHHHGVGIGKAKWMRIELGEAGFEMLQKIKNVLDPHGLMNKGKLGL